MTEGELVTRLGIILERVVPDHVAIGKGYAYVPPEDAKELARDLLRQMEAEGLLIVSIEAAIRRINGAGYRVNNLFQRHDGRWQANVVDPAGKGEEFAVDLDPARALLLAMSNAKLELAWYRLVQAVERVERLMVGGDV